MPYDLLLAWRNIQTRPLQSLITVLVVALALALFVAVAALNSGVKRGIADASDPFGVLVVGPEGDPQQLVLSTVLLQGLPLGNMSIKVYEDLQADPRVALAIPIAMGDNIGGARILGVSQNFFLLRPNLNAPPTFQIAEGRIFAADFEVVLGSAAAAATGLQIGDQFVPQHGVAAGINNDNHAVPHTVVGILQPSRSPYDGAVFTTVQSVHAVHAGSEQSDMTLPSVPAGILGQAALPVDEQITAVLVQPVSFAAANEIWRELRINPTVQAAFPGRELGRLFDLLNQGQRVLNVVGYVAVVMAALTLLLAIYSTTLARERVIAVMRSLGASRLSVFRMILFEAVLIALLGALLGRILGYSIALLVAQHLSAQSAIPIPIYYMGGLEVLLWLLPLGLALLGGVLPAIFAYRVNVVEKLFPR